MASAGNKLKLVYFGAFGGRAQPIKDALAIGKIDHEFEGLDFPTFGAQKAAGRFPLGSVPVISVTEDGPLIPQSNAILRYVGKLANLYPTNPEEALLVDAILDTSEEAFKGTANKGNSPEEFKALREKVSSEDVPKALRGIEALASGGKYLVGSSLTIADLKVWSLVSIIQSGFIDHVSIDLSKAPKVEAWYPGITAERTAHGLK